MTYLIRDMPADNRPRERMFRHGAKILSDAELLAVILGTGAAGKNAIHLAQELLVGGVQSLRNRDFASLARTRGIGPAKIARIGAAIELSRRMAAPPKEGPKLYSAAAVGRELIANDGDQMQERFGAVLLDARQRVMKRHHDIFVGTLDKTLVSAREVIRLAVIGHAKGVVIYHNHPSGDPAPSDDDVNLTRKLRESLEIVDIELVDHLITGRHGYVSLKDLGML